MSIINMLLNAEKLWDKPCTPADRDRETSLRLVCRVSLHPDGYKPLIDGVVTSELFTLLSSVEEAVLFLDVDYGQWGLRLFGDKASNDATKKCLIQRPRQFRDTDRVVGEFLGDSDFLICDMSSPVAAYLIALPIDSRQAWYHVGDSLLGFLEKYISLEGDKFWEQS